MDLNLLMQPLPVADDPGLETTDPRLEEVSTLVQRAQYMEAAGVAESVLAEGIYDIRMIGFLAYGVFLERGPGGLKEVFDCLAALLRDNWAAVGPAGKRQKHTQTSLRWFFNQLLKKLQYEESSRSALWEQWGSEVTSDAIGEAIEAADGLKRAANAVLEEAAAPLVDGLAKLAQWLRTFQQLVYREPEPETADEPEMESGLETVETGEDEPPVHLMRGDSPAVRAESTDFSATEEGLFVEGSHLLKGLMEKMEAFERLIAEEKYSRAALVADDINEIISTFDPRLYFPKLFARYAYLKVANFQELYSYEDQKETAEWLAWKEFLKVDLKAFVES